MKQKSKIYLRPFGFFGSKEGKLLEKKNKAIKLADGYRYFTKIEIIKKTSNIISEIMSVEKFLELIEKKKKSRFNEYFI